MPGSDRPLDDFERSAELAAGTALGRLRTAEAFLEEHSVIPDFVRQRPAVAVGVAFGAGFFLAAMGHRPRRWVLRSAYRRAGRAVVAGIGAIALAEIRQVLTGTDSNEIDDPALD